MTVMGHVDHGKTSLLDVIARTDVVSKEVGGITQGISAFTVTYGGRRITFVDTPGHEAFLAMRRRGGKVADIILLIVAGSEGVKPQTQEAIAHLKESSAIPIAVITKMDLPEANPEKIKRQLAENGVLVEGLGGQIPVALVSIKDPESIKKLLDLILLVTDLNEILGSVDEELEAVVVESLVDRKKGPLALVAVRRGKLSLGQEVHTITATGRIRNLMSNHGEPIFELPCGEAAWVMGFSQAPKVGEGVLFGKTEEPAPKTAVTTARAEREVPGKKEEGRAENLNVILKADTLGSLEALESGLLAISQTGGKVDIVASGIGDVNNSDVYLAKDSGAVIIAFKVRTLGSAAELARDKEVEIQTYEIIYKLLDDAKLALSGLSQWTKREGKPGAEVIKIFELPSGDRVLGCKVKRGTLREGQNVVVKKGEEELFKSSIKNIKIGKQSVEKASAPNECGLLLKASDVSAVESGDEILVI